MQFYNRILENVSAGRKMLSVLVDPDRLTPGECMSLVKKAEESGIDCFFAGSSLITGSNFERCIGILKESNRPVVLFPGNHMQISNRADAILFLSLISGRNPEMLIGRHVLAAPVLKTSSMEVIPTGYMLIDGGAPTSVSYMSGTAPIPYDKSDIAQCTAIAGEMLGMKLIYLDAGSGAHNPVSRKMISEVKKQIGIPLIVGGGIRTPEAAYESCAAGADMIVVGNILEKDPELLSDLAAAVHSLQSSH